MASQTASHGGMRDVSARPAGSKIEGVISEQTNGADKAGRPLYLTSVISEWG
jgi:hypothetical protein